MKPFSERIQKCMDSGRLTGVDLSIWFGRPYHTVRTWRIGKHEPWSPWEQEAERCLTVLERLIREHKKFPIPASFKASERQDYMRGLVRERDTRLSQTRSAG